MSAFSKELRSFLIVSQSSSIRDAALQLNISAPALSRQMQILERSYGVALLIRSANGIALTAEGETLRDQAKHWLKGDTDLTQKLRQQNQTGGLLLRIGVMECMVDTLIPILSKCLEEKYENVSLDVTVGSTDLLLEEAEQLRLDLMVAFNMPRLERHITTDSFEYHIGAVSAPSMDISEHETVSLQDALKFPVCLPSAGLSFHQRLLAEVLSVRVNPRISVQSNSIGLIKQYLCKGNSVGFLTWLDVKNEVEDGTLKFRSLQNKRLTETLSLTICRGNNLAENTGKVLELVKQEIIKLGN